MADLPPFAEVFQYEALFGSAPAGVDQMLEAASALVRNACRWHVWPIVTETVTLDGPGRDMLSLPSLKVTAVTSVTETQRGKGATVATVDVDDLEWSAAGLVWRHDRRCWTSRARGVTVTFSHGWEAPPPEITQTVLAVAGRSRANPLRLTQMSVGQRSESYGGGNPGAPGGLLMDELDTLAPYRRIV